MRKFISGLIICVLFAMPLLEVSGSGLTIVRLSKKAAGPFDVVKIFGSGFTAASDMRVIFANGAYVVSVPPVYGTKTTLEAPVPFFFDKKSGAIKSGVVRVTVKSKSLGIKSNTISGFTITDLPRSTQAAGTITLVFLEDLKTLTGYSKTQLAFLKKASKGKVNTTQANSQISKMETSLGGLQTAVTAIQKGQATTQASSIKVTKSSLAIADRLFLAYLAQLDAVAKAPLGRGVTAVPDRASVPADALSIPSLKQIYEKLASYAKDADFNEEKLWEFLKRNEGVVGTTASVLVLGATALSLPTVATAVGGMALIYSAGIAFYTVNDYMAFYLGLPSGVTKADGFWPLFEALLTTGLDMATFHLPDTVFPKQMYDLYSQYDDDIDLTKRLVGPVEDSTKTLVPELLRIGISGSWAGRLTVYFEGEEETVSLSANFTESGLSFSGQMTLADMVGSVIGTINGYNTSFTYTHSETYQGILYNLSCLFSDGLSADGRSMSGKCTVTETAKGYTPTTFTGTWILSR